MFRQTAHLWALVILTAATAGCSSNRSARFLMVDMESGTMLTGGSGTLFRPEYSMFNNKGIKRFPTVSAATNGEVVISGFRNHDIVLLSVPGHHYATVGFRGHHTVALLTPNPPLEPDKGYPAREIVKLEGIPVVVPMLRGEGEVPPHLLRMSYPAE